jgi:N-acetylmuramoyl-L-alanine amidase
MIVARVAVRRLVAAGWRRRVIAIPIVLAAVITGSASGITLIRVHPGDTLSAIALRYHTTVTRLIALNDLPGDGNLIFAGETLRVPGGRAQSSSHTVTTYHLVVPGDTLDGIAARYHVSPMKIARRNHLPSSLIVVLGTRLAIPHRVTTTPGNGVLASLDQRPEPDRDQIDAMIRSTSAHWGLDPRLALAISWQESGWNMREVSKVGAVGAMQIMPSTGAYLSDDVLHRRLDLGDAQDNITAGVALLSILTHEASSTPQAVAGYYQGLESVRQNGMYASTKHYVANVLSLQQQYHE